MNSLKTMGDGIEYIEIINEVACANIALQGAHIFHYSRLDEPPLIWLSDSSDFQKAKAIRGGVPICWPRFGNLDKSLPQHGFARTEMFELVSVEEVNAKTTEVVFRLKENENTLEIWNYKFELELKVTITDKLTMELTTTNTDNKAYKITQALHSYFEVGNISDVAIKGLDSKPYFDAVDSKNKLQKGDINFDSEVNRVYQDVQDEIVLKDKQRTICVKNEGSSSVVVWNPWAKNCKEMSAFKIEAYKNFVCIESSNAFDDFIMIEAGKSHTLKATIDSF